MFDVIVSLASNSASSLMSHRFLDHQCQSFCDLSSCLLSVLCAGYNMIVLVSRLNGHNASSMAISVTMFSSKNGDSVPQVMPAIANSNFGFKSLKMSLNRSLKRMRTYSRYLVLQGSL
jgi:hypothetical protein